MRPVPHPLRRAFTLIELLVVIAIIGVLMSLLAVAVFRWISRQRERNSETLVKAVHEVLRQHWTKVIEEAKGEPIPDVVVNYLNGGARDDRARVIWIKLRLTEAFPMSYYEAVYPLRIYDSGAWVDLIPQKLQKYKTVYWDKLKSVLTDPSPDQLRLNPTPDTESAACLLMALSVGRKGVPSLNVDLLPLVPQDTDSDGVKELVDGFGLPVSFFRFPTTNQDLQNANPAPKDKFNNSAYGDALDPKRLLVDQGWWTGPSGSNLWRSRFQEVCRYTPGLLSGGNLQPLFTTPVIVARGGDGQLGLRWYEPYQAPAPSKLPGPFSPPPGLTWHTNNQYADMNVDNAAFARDNIYSFKLAAPQ